MSSIDRSAGALGEILRHTPRQTRPYHCPERSVGSNLALLLYLVPTPYWSTSAYSGPQSRIQDLQQRKLCMCAAAQCLSLVHKDGLTPLAELRWCSAGRWASKWEACGAANAIRPPRAALWNRLAGIQDCGRLWTTSTIIQPGHEAGPFTVTRGYLVTCPKN